VEPKVFLDTAYAISLSSEHDNLHELALQIADVLETEQTSIITTQAIMLEIGNALSKQRFRRAAVILLHALESDPSIEIIPLSQELYDLAFDLFRQRSDKDWGLIDCVSFIVMQQSGITQALTTDVHYQQAGFQALMRQPA
jgi:predicted nucleic acid-binding protein